MSPSQLENRLYRMLVNGQLVCVSETFDVINPATGRVFAKAPRATAQHVAAAIIAARGGSKTWALTPQPERAGSLLQAASIMEAHRVDLEHLLSHEQGKPLSGARSETNTAISMLRQAAQVTLPGKTVKETVEHFVKVRRKPVGVVVGITPWNFPLSLGVGKIARALAHGNAVILKPSPFTPLTSLYIGEILKDVFPPGVLNVVTGDDDMPGTVSVGQQLVDSPDVNMVSFTGSVPTGKRIMAACAKNVTRVLLELGGNDPAIVLPDADVAHAAKGIYQMTMANSGQICCAIKRVYVHESINEEFVSAVTQLAKRQVPHIGQGTVEGVTMGPLNNAAQLGRVKELVADAIANGATLNAGGKVPSHTNPDGFFYEPTIITGVKEGTRIVDEEQFGPVMPVMSYSSEAEVIKRANNSVYGLGASVWGSCTKSLNRIVDQLEAGIVWTNQHAVLREGGSFGGVKQSGFRREGDFAEADLDAYTEMQTVKLAK